MNIQKNLLKIKGKEDVQAVRDFICETPDRFAELMSFFLGADQKVAQKAAWVLDHTFEKRPFLVVPYTADLIEVLGHQKHPAIYRNSLKILAELDLPEDLLGAAADHAFNFLLDPKAAIAVRVHAMTVLWNIVKKEPELAPELRMVLEDQIPHGSAGFKNRGQKILKAIHKLEAQSNS